MVNEISTPTVKPILVIGVGNSIQMDDGIGMHVLQALEGHPLPDSVELFDGGTAGLDLLPYLQNRHTVIVIDAVDAGMEAGTLFRFTPEDIAAKRQHYDSLHQLGLLETIRMAGLLGTEPERAVIIGVQPGVIDWGEELSETLRKSIPRIIELVLKEVWEAVQHQQENNCQHS